MYLYSDAIEDSLYGAYFLAIVYPVCYIAAKYMISRGMNLKQSQAFQISILLPSMLILSVCLYNWWYSPLNAYEVLKINRQASTYKIGKVYAQFRKLKAEKKLSDIEWNMVDAAYDKLYDDKTRQNYESWGKDGMAISGINAVVVISAFYIIWLTVGYIIAIAKESANGGPWILVALALILVLEISMKIFNFYPAFFNSCRTTTPHEVLMWLHRLFPIYVCVIMMTERIYHIDDVLHHNKILKHLLQSKHKIIEELRTLRKELTTGGPTDQKKDLSVDKGDQ